jgi:DNA-binding transcriptional LysR family regulator
MSGITHVVLLPGLMERLAAVAPGVSIEVVPISLESAHLLETGLADLAVGFVPELEAGFYQQRLFEQRFVCVVRCRHPRLRSRMTAAAYQREKHLVVTSPGAGEELVVRALEAAGLEREVVLQLPNFLGIGALVSQTDLVITLPIRVAQTLVQISQVKLLEPPFPSPTFVVKQHWHERFHQDAANRWLRSVISELFLDVQGGK